MIMKNQVKKLSFEDRLIVVIKVYIDGGSRGNPGIGAFGFIVTDVKNGELFRYGKKIGHCTNNIAEYNALISALQYLIKNGFESKNSKGLTIYSDSKLLVNQMTGQFKVRSGAIIPLFKKAQRLIHKLKRVKIEYVNRRYNRTADWIVNRILDDKTFKSN